MGYDEPKLKRLAYLMGKAEEGDAFAAFLLRVELGEVETCEHPDGAYRIRVTREETMSFRGGVAIDRDRDGGLWLPVNSHENCVYFLWQVLCVESARRIVVWDMGDDGVYRASGEVW